MENEPKIKVSVRLMVYNHEVYLKQAIESILMQKTNFITEIVIGDDFSTDNSLKIAKEFISTEKFIIKILDRKKGDEYHKKRLLLGRLYNFTNIIENCSGKYIALLDGDDYWIDPLKLQKQVDLLESNNELVLCHTWHLNGIYTDDGRFLEVEAPKQGFGFLNQPIVDVSKIFSNEMRCKSRTILFRNIIKKFPDWFYKVAFGDVALSMILGKYGKFAFINEPTAVYRLTGLGVSTVGNELKSFVLDHYINWIKLWELGDLHYDGRYRQSAISTEKYFYQHILKKYNFSWYIIRKILYYILFLSKNSIKVRLVLFRYVISRSYFKRV